MKHELLLLGKEKSSYIEQGIADFSKRLSHYTRFTTRLIKEKKTGKNSGIEGEGILLMQNVTPGAFVIALDPKGKQFTSEQFASKISELESRSVKSVSYLIGGPLGLSDQVRNRADLLLSLSKMTFTHDMARLLLIEQLYRAYTIKAGEKYHK